MSWYPKANIEILERRATIIAAIRQYFAKHNFLEIDVPLISDFGVTDLNLDNIKVGEQYLITSPEFFLKRLLVKYPRNIYYLGKSFRKQDKGRLHNQEFTILEWYNLNFNFTQIIQQTIEIIQLCYSIYNKQKLYVHYISYYDCFKHIVGLDNIFNISKTDLQQFIQKQYPVIYHSYQKIQNYSKIELEQIIFMELIEPNLGLKSLKPNFNKTSKIDSNTKLAISIVKYFPKYISSLAKIYQNDANNMTVSRFEVYLAGIELANGYDELQSVAEHKHRFNYEQLQRKRNNLETRKIDQKFMAAIEVGLPACTGVALGIDRLVMLCLKKHNIKEVISFIK